MIKADGIAKSFGDKVLFENLSFNLPRGGIVGVIGPNGAGKTTTINRLLGFLEPSFGSPLVAGIDVAEPERRATSARLHPRDGNALWDAERRGKPQLFR